MPSDRFRQWKIRAYCCLSSVCRLGWVGIWSFSRLGLLLKHFLKSAPEHCRLMLFPSRLSLYKTFEGLRIEAAKQDAAIYLDYSWDRDLSYVWRCCIATWAYLKYIPPKCSSLLSWKITCTKYPKCYYFHTANVMKCVSSIYHSQFPLKPCARLKIKLKTGKSIWLQLKCGYCSYHKFFSLKITWKP